MWLRKGNPGLALRDRGSSRAPALERARAPRPVGDTGGVRWLAPPLLLLLLAAATACGAESGSTQGGAPTEPAAPPTPAPTASPVPAPTATPTPTPTPAPDLFFLDVVTETFVDPVTDRSLVTTIAAPAAAGPFPLVLYAHGLSSGYDDHASVVSQLASAGYVVAVPEFPGTSGPEAGPADVVGVVDQPGDLTFVTNEVLRLANEGVIAPIDRERIGVLGHSLGGTTAYGFGYAPGVADSRVQAVASIAGALLERPDGPYDFSGPPLLLIHGDADDTVDIAQSQQVFDAATAPTWFITLLGGTHSGWRDEVAPTQEVVVDSLVRFFDLWLKGDFAAQERLEDGAVVPGVSAIDVDALQ